MEHHQVKAIKFSDMFCHGGVKMHDGTWVKFYSRLPGYPTPPAVMVAIAKQVATLPGDLFEFEHAGQYYALRTRN